MTVHETATIEDSTVEGVEVREYVTIHDSTIGSGSRIYERVSIKKSAIAGPADVNANAYVENAEIGERVQIGPNATVAGVTHHLDATGMTFREDTFETVFLDDGAFVGAGATVLPGVTVGENAVVGANATVTDDVPPKTVLVDESERTARPLDG